MGTGAAAGAAAGAVVAGVGAGPGAVAGGIIGAAGASLYEAGKETTPPKKEESYNPGSNINNPYDNVGFEHYHAINEALSSSSNYLSNDNYDNTLFYDFSSNLAVQDSIVDEQDLLAFPLSLSDSVLGVVSNAGDDLVVYFNGITEYDSVVKDCLTPYFQCFEASENAEVGGFVQYSIDMENAVTNMAMSEFDRQIILSVMATARYGSQYWSLQY